MNVGRVTTVLIISTEAKFARRILESIKGNTRKQTMRFPSTVLVPNSTIHTPNWKTLTLEQWIEKGLRRVCAHFVCPMRKLLSCWFLLNGCKPTVNWLVSKAQTQPMVDSCYLRVLLLKWFILFSSRNIFA